MASGKDNIKYRSPLAVSSDEENDYCRACVVVKGLIKPDKKGSDRKNPKNGEVKLDLKERSFEIKIKLDLGEKDKNNQVVWENFRYSVKQLPDIIVPDECTYKYRTDMVVILLKKKENRSWVKELAKGGLETFGVNSDSESSGEEFVMTLDESVDEDTGEKATPSNE